MYIGPRVKYTLFLSEFDQTWIFLIYFQKKKIQNIKFHENRPVGDELFHADQQTRRS